MKREKILLVDGHALAFRAFYALPELTAADGTPTNAVVGFFNMFRKILDDWSPDLCGVMFDAPGPTFRHEAYEEYKAGRKPTPEEFKVQTPIIVEMLKALGVPVTIRAGVEADDVIASVACTAAREGVEALVLTSDKDLLQILAPGISVLRPQKGISTFTLLDEKAFGEEYGFPPSVMREYLALVGDAVDNVPGVTGVGDKTAKQLVMEYGSLERIYENLALLKPALRKKLEEGRERAFYSRELVTLLCDTKEDLTQFRPGQADREHFAELCRALGLQKIQERFLPAEARLDAEEGVLADDLAAVPLEDILSEKELVCVLGNPGSQEIVLMTPASRYARFSGSVEKILGELADGIILVEDYKKTLSVLESKPLPSDRVRDFITAHYLLHPDGPTHDLRALFPGYDGLPLERRAALLHGEYCALRERIAGYEGLEGIMATIDLPLVPILVDMERHGVGCSLDAYGDLERDLASRVGQIEGAIAKVAGESINLNSPKQMGWLLFEKMSLPSGKRTKTGYSTDVTVLEGLVAMGKPYDEVPALLLEYRELTKMLSGFVQPLTKAAEAGKGVIHGTFEPAVTGTGRLSSRDPNLQNLPSFGEWSKRIKEGLHPKGDGNIFVSADYSQIELRVLAHLSDEERLKDSFHSGRDIHTETASWVFSIEPGLVTPELRRVAKMINFGLLYGMSSFGLAQRLAMGRQEASEIIRRYFTALPAVEAYLEESYDEAKRRGYTKTIMGRIRPLAEVPVSPRDRDGLRRVAVNSPIQGTAADIARKAMVDFNSRFPASGDVHLVLQVHDSLVCECPEGKAPEVEEALRHLMEQTVHLSVPLQVESKRGRTLADV